MSDVYISGMEMPTEGFITVTITSDGRVAGNSQKINGKFEYLDNKDIASAIPVSDHGRLIDADEFLKRAIGTKCFREDYALMLEELVGGSTTIIPADLPVMYYPQVPGITPTVISDTEEDR